MNLYLVENHVKYTMDAECKALTETKQSKSKAQLNTNRLGIVQITMISLQLKHIWNKRHELVACRIYAGGDQTGIIIQFEHGN